MMYQKKPEVTEALDPRLELSSGDPRRTDEKEAGKIQQE